MTTQRAKRVYASAETRRKTDNTGAIDVLDATGIERLCEMCAEGMNRGEIAKSLGCSRRMLSYWLAKDETNHRLFLDAERTKADWHAEEAGRVLMELPDEPSKEQVARAKEIANHHRWIAEKFDRRRYGNQVTVEHKETPAAELDDAALHARIDELTNAYKGTRLQ